MNNILLFLCVVVAVATGLADDAKKYSLQNQTNSLRGRDKYVNLIRQENSKILKDYDTQLKIFKKSYLGRVEEIYVQTNLIIAIIKQTIERLNPLKVLSDLSEQCVTRYRYQIPTVTQTKEEMTHCVTEASSQVTILLQNAFNIRNDLESHFKNKFEEKIKLCEKKFANKTKKYDLCLKRKISKTNDFIIKNQKNFEIKMGAAECTAKTYIKRAFDCSYSVRTKTIFQVARTNVAINKCLEAEEVCEPCNNFSCPNTYKWKVDHENRTILNPFYGKNKQPDCLMLELE